MLFCLVCQYSELLNTGTGVWKASWHFSFLLLLFSLSHQSLGRVAWLAHFRALIISLGECAFIIWLVWKYSSSMAQRLSCPATAWVDSWL